MRAADCHPERKHYCKGLCKNCYHAAWSRKEYKKNGAYAARIREQSRDWAYRNPDKIRAMWRTVKRRNLYGITNEEYEALSVQQRGACALCQKPESVTYRGRVRELAVDHCHETGKVRGLLCMRCNVSICIFAQNPTVIDRLREYLGRGKIE